MKLNDIRPSLTVVDGLIQEVKDVQEHYITDEDKREAYLTALLDVKNALLTLVEEPDAG